MSCFPTSFISCASGVWSIGEVLWIPLLFLRSSSLFWKMAKRERVLQNWRRVRKKDGGGVIKNVRSEHSESTNMVSDKSVPILWLWTVNVCFLVCWCHTVETRRGKNVFLLNIYQNMISKKQRSWGVMTPLWMGKHKNNKLSVALQVRINPASEITTWHLEELFNMLPLTWKLTIYPRN